MTASFNRANVTQRVAPVRLTDSLDELIQIDELLTYLRESPNGSMGQFAESEAKKKGSKGLAVKGKVRSILTILSRNLEKLEDFFGVKLVERDRGTRGVLAEKNPETVDGIQAKIRQMAQLYDALKGMKANRPGCSRLRIGTFPSIAAYALPDVTAALASRHHGLDIFYSPTGSQDRLAKDLRDGMCDVILCNDEGDSDGLTRISLDYRVPAVGLVFLMPEHDAQRFPQLADFVCHNKQSDLHAILKETPLLLLGPTQEARDDATVRWLGRMFLDTRKSDNASRFVVPTYRHIRLYVRAGVGVGAGPIPRHILESAIKRPGCVWGYDEGFPKKKLAFIPLKYLATKLPAVVERRISGLGFAIYVRKNYQEPEFKGGLSVAGHDFIKTVEQLCTHEDPSIDRLNWIARGRNAKSRELLHDFLA